ncbi:hypothetical protein JCM2811A_27130 [Methylorubrum rhodinum]
MTEHNADYGLRGCFEKRTQRRGDRWTLKNGRSAGIAWRERLIEHPPCAVAIRERACEPSFVASLRQGCRHRRGIEFGAYPPCVALKIAVVPNCFESGFHFGTRRGIRQIRIEKGLSPRAAHGYSGGQRWDVVFQPIQDKNADTVPTSVGPQMFGKLSAHLCCSAQHPSQIRKNSSSSKVGDFGDDRRSIYSPAVEFGFKINGRIVVDGLAIDTKLQATACEAKGHTCDFTQNGCDEPFEPISARRLELEEAFF